MANPPPLTLSTEFSQALAKATERWQVTAAQVDVTARMHSAARIEYDVAERDLRELGRAIALLRAQQAAPASSANMEATIAAAVRAALGAPTATAPAAPPVALHPEAIKAAGGDPTTLDVLQQMASNPGQPLRIPESP